MHRTSRSLTLLCGLLAGGCLQPQNPDAPNPVPAGVAVLKWMECEECVHGQLDAVLQSPAAAQPLLIAYLEGPPPQRREQYREHLVRTHAKLAAYAQTHPDRAPMGQERYISLYMANYIARYQTRAAVALNRIGSIEARQALEEALADEPRQDVQRLLDKMLDDWDDVHGPIGGA